MNKKVLWFLSVLMIAAFVLSACGGTEAPVAEEAPVLAEVDEFVLDPQMAQPEALVTAPEIALEIADDRSVGRLVLAAEPNLGLVHVHPESVRFVLV